MLVSELPNSGKVSRRDRPLRSLPYPAFPWPRDFKILFGERYPCVVLIVRTISSGDV
jgi:hypothetical protein